jgi:hypothetical protein
VLWLLNVWCDVLVGLLSLLQLLTGLLPRLV